MSIPFWIESDNAHHDAWTREMRGLEKDVADWRAAWRPVSDEIYSIERAQHQTEGTRGSGRWPKRAKSTLDRITSLNRRGFTAKVVGLPLRLTDTEFRALTTRGAAHGIYIEEPQQLTVGTDLRYARYHQFGTSRMPRRKLYDFTDKDIDVMQRIMRRSLREKIADRGFDVSTDDRGLPF